MIWTCPECVLLCESALMVQRYFWNDSRTSPLAASELMPAHACTCFRAAVSSEEMRTCTEHEEGLQHVLLTESLHLKMPASPGTGPWNNSRVFLIAASKPMCRPLFRIPVLHRPASKWARRGLQNQHDSCCFGFPLSEGRRLASCRRQQAVPSPPDLLTHFGRL